MFLHVASTIAFKTNNWDTKVNYFFPHSKKWFNSDFCSFFFVDWRLNVIYCVNLINVQSITKIYQIINLWVSTTRKKPMQEKHLKSWVFFTLAMLCYTVILYYTTYMKALECIGHSWPYCFCPCLLWILQYIFFFISLNFSHSNNIK